MSKINNETLQSILGSKTVAFHAVFAKALASVPAAVMLSQAIFWQESARYKRTGITIDGAEYFQATAEDWFEETGLTKEQQATSRKILAGILQEKRAGVPAKMHYRIDIDALVAVIYRYLNEGIPVRVDYRSKLRQKPRTSSGKFRQLEAVKNGNSYNIESLESLESVREEAPAPVPEIWETVSSTLEAEKNAPPPQIPVAPPAPLPTAFDRWILNLRENYTVRDGFRIGHKIPDRLFDDYLARFESIAKTQPEKYFKQSDLTGHFLSWSRIEYTREPSAPAKPAASAPAVGIPKNIPVYGT